MPLEAGNFQFQNPLIDRQGLGDGLQLRIFLGFDLTVGAGHAEGGFQDQLAGVVIE